MKLKCSFSQYGHRCLLQAIRAGAEINHTAEAYHLLKAKKWNHSHSVVMQHIASDAVVNGMIQLFHCVTLFEFITACWWVPVGTGHAWGKPADSV